MYLMYPFFFEVSQLSLTYETNYKHFYYFHCICNFCVTIVDGCSSSHGVSHCE